ncbi:MAG: lipoprotein-releasing ABC transporter permease subunit [Pseudohongiellaceae bacterium]
MTNIPRYVALRYVSMGKRSQLVSFMSAIAIAGLALGIAILITVLSVMNGFDREMRVNILGLVPHITLGGDNLSAATWEEVRGVALSNSMIESASPVIEAGGVVSGPGGSRGIAINGIDLEDGSGSSFYERFMREGSAAALADERWGVVLGQTLADRLQVGLGDEVRLFSTSVSLNPVTPLPTFRDFRIVGIYRVGTEELDSELAMINLAAARALFRVRTPFNGLRLHTTDVLQADAIASELRPQLPTSDSLGISTWSSRFGSIYENIRFSRTIIGLMLWLLVGVAAFNLVVSLIMIVRDKTGDIAILRTLGASPGTINHIFIWQGALIALIGIVIGVAFGVAGALWVSDLAAWIEARFDLQLLSAEVYPIDFLPSQLQWADLVTVTLGVMGLALLATLYPARRAAAIQPADALRHD